MIAPAIFLETEARERLLARLCKESLAQGQGFSLIGFVLEESLGENLQRNILRNVKALLREEDPFLRLDATRYLLLLRGRNPLGLCHLYRDLLRVAASLGGACRFARSASGSSRAGWEEQVAEIDRQLAFSWGRAAA